MNTKWKVILSVMLLLTLICIVFVVLVQQLNDEKIEAIIEGKTESATVMAETLLSDFSVVYRDRIQTFTNPKVSPSRERMIQAFAERDRETLLKMSKPLLQVFKKNPYFATIAWITPDNRVLLRIHAPELFGDDISKIRPDIVAANQTKQQQYGFNAGVSGMQYRVVQPVFYHNKFIGSVQFGIKASFIFDTMWDKLHTHAGMAVLNSENGTFLKSKMPGLVSGEYTIKAKDVELYRPVVDQLDWSRDRQRVVLNDKIHTLINILPANNFRNEELGVFFVALQISEELAQKQNLFFTVLCLSTVILLISYLILYFSYGTLVEKIIVLNQILEKNNLELENRVKERTAKLQESELQLHRAHKMEAIGLMAGGVAHDLNNILSGIIGYPELILQKLEKESELRKAIKAIQECGERAATVVTDLLTVARGAATIREVHNLNDLVQDYMNSPECEKQRSLYPHISYICKFIATHSAVSCSPIHVKKCIMNLAINAAEAIEGSGTITVSTHNQSIDGDVTGSEEKMETGEYVVLSLQDTGSGISSTDLEHIFEPFYTKKKMGRSGTGLGLSIVWSTMEDHGGKVIVDSSEEGTCFQLFFPISKKENNQTVNDMDKKYIGNNEHILVVDDEQLLRNIASQMLLSLGYRVDSVPSGELALQFVKDKPVDLLVIDMLMEPGMSGLQTYEEILKHCPDQKAIIASGFSVSDDVRATFQLGACGFIQKPFSIEQLGQAVHAALKN